MDSARTGFQINPENSHGTVTMVGAAVGAGVGDGVGFGVGPLVVGLVVGAIVGETVGLLVGTTVPCVVLIGGGGGTNSTGASVGMIVGARVPYWYGQFPFDFRVKLPGQSGHCINVEFVMHGAHTSPNSSGKMSKGQSGHPSGSFTGSQSVSGKLYVDFRIGLSIPIPVQGEDVGLAHISSGKGWHS